MGRNAVKRARAADHWRHAYDRPYQVVLKSLKLTDVPGVGAGSLSCAGGITAICGGNGVGKTRVIRAAVAAIAPALLTHREDILVRLEGATVNVVFSTAGTDHDVSASVRERLITRQANAIHGSCEWIDPIEHTADMARLFEQMSGLHEVLEPFGASEATADFLSDASYVVGRDYSRLQTVEIRDYADYDVLPYFMVTWRGEKYGSENMGLGELSALYIIWKVRACNDNSIIVIEEPETFLSPRSQAHLMDVLAKEAGRKGVSIIITTHSSAVMRKIPLEHIRLITRSELGFEIQAPRNRHEALRPLGLDLPKSGLIFVEDRVAASLARAILGRFEPELLLANDVVVSGDNVKVLAALDSLPKEIGWLHRVGLLDGDQRGRDFGGRKDVTFLPGSGAPEELLRGFAKTNPELVVPALGRDIIRVREALESSEGMDHHDWLEEMARSLGFRVEMMVDGLVSAWLAVPNNADIGRSTFEAIRKVLGAPE